MKGSSKESETSKDDEPTCTKIYYASRTHSQLSQVLHELKKLNLQLSPSITSLHSPQDVPDTSNGAKRTFTQMCQEDADTTVDIRSVSLASRKQLCINEKLKAKVADIDEACRQMLGGAYKRLN